MDKIMGTKKLSGIIRKLKKDGKKIGFVTGCFDVVHISHINYFVASKRHVDVLVVGVDNDESIRISKGKNRPIFALNIRSTLLSHLDCVDYVVPMKKPILFGTDAAYQHLLKITKQISPDFLISNDMADKYWKKVRKRAKEARCGFIKLSLKAKSSFSSSTKILEKLQKET